MLSDLNYFWKRIGNFLSIFWLLFFLFFNHIQTTAIENIDKDKYKGFKPFMKDNIMH